MVSFLVSLCSYTAPFAATVVFLAPLPTIQKIKNDKSIGTLPLLPYSSMIANCLLWSSYGILRHEPKVWLTNGTGLCLAIYYYTSFVTFAPSIYHSSPTLPGSVSLHQNGIIIVTVFTLITTCFPTMFFNDAAAAIGNMATLFCICMFAAPLAALKVVLETRNASSIPLPFTIATILNCFLWTIAGLFDLKDVYIYFPNILGLLCGLAQLSLKLIYGGDVLSSSALYVLPLSETEMMIAK